MKIYVLMLRDTEVLAARTTVEEAQTFAENWCGETLTWEHHDSHGQVWVAQERRFNVQEVELPGAVGTPA